MRTTWACVDIDYILPHLIEVQAEKKQDIPERMFDYYALPRRTYRRPTNVDRLFEEGRNKGLLEGRQATLLRLLNKKFGELPDELVARVQAMTSDEDVDALLDQVLVAGSLHEMDLSR